MPSAIFEGDAVGSQEVETPGSAPNEIPIDTTPPRDFTVIRQHVALEFDFRNKTVRGRADIFISLKNPVPEILIDARQCDIDVDNVKVSHHPAKAFYDDPSRLADSPKNYAWGAEQWGVRKQRMQPLQPHRRVETPAVQLDTEFTCTPAYGSLRVLMPEKKDIDISLAKLKKDGLEKTRGPHEEAILKGAMHIVSIPFTLDNIRDGLQFAGVNELDTRYPHVYTRHSVEAGTASSIFPCIDDPGCRCGWNIALTFPLTLGDAFGQPLTAQQSASRPAVESRKRKFGEDSPKPADRVWSLSEEDKLLEMTAICSGRLEEDIENQDDTRTMVFECSSTKAARHMGFAIGPFEHVDLWSEFRTEEDDEKLGSNATKIHGYCLPGREEEVKNTCAALVTAIDHFSMTYGRYPFDSYKVCFVDDMVHDTVPLCGFSLCSTRMLFPENIMDKEIPVTRDLVHSLASQWFGVNIVPNRKADHWLVTGIAWFMTDLFMKGLCGTNWYRFRMKAMADRLVEIDINRPSLESLGEYLHLGDFEVEFMNLKAPLVLFILDRRLSKPSGSAGIARIIAKMVSKANTSLAASDAILGSELFRRSCEKTGQTRLDNFWSQWVAGSGCPRFDVHQKFNKKRLCVEMTVRQVQDIAANKTRPLAQGDFWRNITEEHNAVFVGEPKDSFTGPMTIRIHEADGTPYEHIVEIRDEQAKSARFEIPYNTKYKRLKKSRRFKEKQLAGLAVKSHEDGPEDAVVHCLGDVLQGEQDVEKWGFVEWDETTEQRMDQESYEWIRMDADFEWICELKTDMPPYMYVSQLQQDRDVVAQQDSMLFLAQSSAKTPHPLISTILTRTLMDLRYFYGIRLMGAETLPRHAVESLNQIGLRHLIKSFQTLFHDERDPTKLPPNDFSNKQQYLIQCAIPEAVARVRDKDGRCPREARRFILELLQRNNNEDNCYSDDLYVCKLIHALATCLIPDGKHQRKELMAMSLSFGDDEEEDEEMVDPEPDQFKKEALVEIDRLRRKDEYAPSYRNCYTVAVLDAMTRLMKAKVIPKDPMAFLPYLHDKSFEAVRRQGFECLIELDYLAHPGLLRFIVSAMSTDSSPYVRDRLFKSLCRGLCAIATGENEMIEEKREKQARGDLNLVVEQDSRAIEARQKQKARKTDLSVALASLKDVTKDDEAFKESIWKALDSPVMTIAEKRNVLEICSILFEEEQSLTFVYKYPVEWSVKRVCDRSRTSCIMDFKRSFRTVSKRKFATPLPPPPPPAPAAPPRPEPTRKITLNVNKSAGTPTPTSATKPTTTLNISKSTTAANAGKPVVAASTSSKLPSIVNLKASASANGKPPATSGNPPSTSSKVPATNGKVPYTNGKTPSTNGKAPSAPVKPSSSANSKHPLPNGKPPSTNSPVGGTGVHSSASSAKSAPRTATPKAESPAIASASASEPPKIKDHKNKNKDKDRDKNKNKDYKEPRNDKVKVENSRSMSEIPVAPPERKALPGSSSQSSAQGATAKSSTSTAVSKLAKASSSNKPAPAAKPQLPSAAPRRAGTPGSTLSAPSANPKKRPSAEPLEAPRPSKIVRLDVSNIPMDKIVGKKKPKRESKIVVVKFTAWDRIKKRPTQSAVSASSSTSSSKPKSRIGTPLPDGSSSQQQQQQQQQHRSTNKPSSSLQRSQSFKSASPAASQSPRHSVATSATAAAGSSPPLPPSSQKSSSANAASQSKSSSKTQSQSKSTATKAEGGGAKPPRKPLPTPIAERKPLPAAGGRSALPTSAPAKQGSGDKDKDKTSGGGVGGGGGSAKPQKIKLKLKNSST